VSQVRYVPDRGDLVFMDFSPQAGHEEAGRRPAIVLSPRIYNQKASLCLVCPITNQAKGYSFEVVVPAGLPVTGVVLSDQVKSMDWSARKVAFRSKAPPALLGEVLSKATTLIG
jgi:mRNA interferase MazF